MQYSGMCHVSEVFHPVEIVVVPHVSGDELELAVGAREHVDFRQRRRLLLFRSHISPKDTAPVFDRIPNMANVVFERAVARLQRLIDATPARIKSPSVVGTDRKSVV